MADIQDNNKEKKIQVAIRVRPVIDRENGDQELWEVTDSKTISRNSSDVFQFDRVFSGQETNLDVYDAICKPIIKEVIKGFNATIFAYGQTSSGKTYTMMGDDFTQGVIHYTINDIFKMIQTMNDREFLLRVSVLEIYNEKVYDLLSQKNDDLRLREDSYGVLKVCDLKEKIVQTSEQIWNLILDGQTKRRTAETQMNRTSSRSHFIFRMIIESSLKGEEDPIVNVSQLNLVDLAGSEKTSLNIGKRFKEGAFINLSLSTLTQVINKLSDEKSGQFINYRNSKLTRILQNSLGGNAHTAIICTVTPVSDKETFSTLSFASSAIKIKNKPQKNEILTDEAMLKRYANEIKKLSQELKTIKEQGELELEEKTRQNENLKKQIEKLKANFVGQSPQNNLVNPRSARRETLCCVSETKKLLNFRNAAVRFPSNFQLPNISEEDCETESELPDFMKHRNSRGTSRLSTSSLSSTVSSKNNQKDIGVQTSNELFEDNNADIDELMTMISDLKSQLTTLQNEYAEQTEYITLEKQILKAEHELQVENQELKAENVILKRKLESKSLLEKSHVSFNNCKELESNLSKHDFLGSNNNNLSDGKLRNSISFNNSLISEKGYSNKSMIETSRMTVCDSTVLDDSHEKSNFLALYDEMESDTISKFKSEIEVLKHDIEIKNKQLTLLNDKILIKDQFIASLQDEIALNKNTDSPFDIKDKTPQIDEVCQTDFIHISPTKSLNCDTPTKHVTEDKFTEVTPRKSREFSTQYCRNEVVDEHFVQTSPMRDLNLFSECIYTENLKVDKHSEISDSFLERTLDAKKIKSSELFHQSSQTSPVSLREIDKERDSIINNEVFIFNSSSTPKESDICRCGYFSDETKILIKKVSDLKYSACNILKKCLKTEYLKDADKYLSDINDCYSKSALDTVTDLETLLSILGYYISNRDQDYEIINNQLESKFQETNMLDLKLSEVKQALNIKESELSSLRDLFFDLKQSFSQLTSICQVLNNVDSQEKFDEIKQRSSVTVPSQSFRLEFEMTMFKNHFVELNSYIEENASKIITLSEDLKKVKSELAAAQNEGFKLLENSYRFKNTVTKSVQTSQDLDTTDTTEKDGLILELKEEINALHKQINHLEEKNKALRKDIDDLYNSDSETIENIERERENRWKIKSEMLIKDLEQKYDQELIDQEKKYAEELIYQKRKFAEVLNVKIQEIKQENLKQVQDLKVEIEQMKLSHNKEMSAIKNQHEDQLASVCSAKQELERQNEEKISALKEKYIAKQNKFIKAYSELNVRVQHYMKEIEKLKKENTPSNQLQVMEKLKEKISELSDEKDMLQKKCTRTDLQISDLKAHNNYLKNELKKISEEEPNQNTLSKLSKLEEMNKQLLDDLDQKKAKVMTLQSNNASMLQELKKLKEMQLSKASVSCKCKSISKESNLDIPEKNEHKKDRKNKINPKDELEDQMKIAKQRSTDENATPVHNDFSNNRTPDQNALLCMGGGSGSANMVKNYWLQGIIHQKDKEIQKLKEDLRDLKSQLRSKRMQPLINEEQSEIKENEVKKETKKAVSKTPVSPLQEIDENVTVQLKTSHPYPGGAVPKIPKKHASREKNGLTTSKPYDKHKNVEHIRKENITVDWRNPVSSNVNNEPKTKYDVVNQLADSECKQQ